MRFIRRYLIPRLIQYMLVIFLGVTLVFFLPRLLSADPVERVIAMITTHGGVADPAALKETIRIMREMYGLEAGLFSQYVSFWQRLFTGDFGPSLILFPTPVVDLIGRALPWTVGLLVTTTVLGWIIGNIVGGLTGYFTRSRLLKIVDGIAMFVRPLPPYIVGLMLIIVFAYQLALFPLSGGYTVGTRLAFTWHSVTDLLKHAFLPAMSLILLRTAVSHQTMRLLVQSVKDEDYVWYAKIGGVKKRTIFARYVVRNALLPQVTWLAMSLGIVFSGAIIVEIVFAYPGIGYLLFHSILHGDYNMLMGIMTISIVMIATCVLTIDLLYPLLDPRIRFK